MVDGYASFTGSFGIIAIDGASVLPDIYGQECGSPLPVCNPVIPVGDPGFQSFGNKCDFPGAGTNCLFTAERGSAWYQVNIAAAGNLEFDIVPNDWPGAPSTACTDYDFAIWETGASGLSCAQLATTPPVKCNSQASGGVTGVYTMGNSPAIYGAFNNSYETPIAVAAGQVYKLMISNDR